MMRAVVCGAALSAMANAAAWAGPEAFGTGPLIADFGPHAAVPSAASLPSDVRFNVVFDVAEPAESGAANRRIESAARFLNMHVAAGASPEAIKLAVVVHGKAAFDLRVEGDDGAPNPTAPLIAALSSAGVRVILCGQTAVHYDLAPETLAPGVEVALSAMTAHARLQQEGYTLNPF